MTHGMNVLGAFYISRQRDDKQFPYKQAVTIPHAKKPCTRLSPSRVSGQSSLLAQSTKQKGAYRAIYYVTEGVVVAPFKM